MNSIFSTIFLLFFLYQNVLADEEYFKNSIFRELESKKGQFSSEIEYILPLANRTVTVQENYSFKLNAGWVNGTESYDHPLQDNELLSLISIYSQSPNSNVSRLYEYYCTKRHRHCNSFVYRQSYLKYHLAEWAPSIVFSPKFNFTILGPNVIMELLSKNHDHNKEAVKCNDEPDKTRKCSISFEEVENFRVKLDYYFLEKDNHTMYPEKVFGFLKTNSSGEWQLAAKFNYLKFAPIFGEQQIVSSDLPIGLGCRRIDPMNYPRPATNRPRRFELQYNVTFNHIDMKQNLSAYNYRELSKVLKYLTSNYSGKMYVDLDNSLNIAEGIDEVTNGSTRSYYNTKTYELHTVNLTDHSCTTYNHSANNSNTLNWFFVQDSFVKRPKYYRADNYSYLREHKLGDVPCLVFEKKFDSWLSLGFGFDFFSKKETRQGVRANRNNVVADDYVIVTHYQPKDPSYWPGNTGKLVVPKRIEIQILHYLRTISYLTIDVNSFNPNPTNFTKYDISKCVKFTAKGS